MIDIIYLCFLVYVIVSVVRHRKTMLMYGASPSEYVLLIISLLACCFRWLVLLVPLPLCRLLVYPVPLVVISYIPAIVVGMCLSHKYETSGTDMAEHAERAARSTTWAGVAGIIIVIIGWVWMIASNHISKG